MVSAAGILVAAALGCSGLGSGSPLPAAGIEEVVSLIQQPVEPLQASYDSATPGLDLPPIPNAANPLLGPLPYIPVTPPPDFAPSVPRPRLELSEPETIDIEENPYFNPLPQGVDVDSLDSLAKYVLEEIRQMQAQAAKLAEKKKTLVKQVEVRVFDIQDQVSHMREREVEQSRMLEKCQAKNQKYLQQIHDVNEQVGSVMGNRWDDGEENEVHVDPKPGVTQDYSAVMETNNWNLRPPLWGQKPGTRAGEMARYDERHAEKHGLDRFVRG